MDKQLEEMLQRPEPHIGDDGFSEGVLSRLPRRRFSRAKSRRWTLAGAAAIGSFLTLLLAPPVETAFRLSQISGGYQIMIFTSLLAITILLIPVAWLLYSQLEEDFKMPDRPWSFFLSRMFRF